MMAAVMSQYLAMARRRSRCYVARAKFVQQGISLALSGNAEQYRQSKKLVGIEMSACGRGAGVISSSANA